MTNEFRPLKNILFSDETLTDRERKILELLYVNENSRKDVAKIMGVTQERIRQVEAKALRKLSKGRPAKVKCRQVIVNWYEPDKDEKVPKDGIIVAATVSGKNDKKHITYDHALVLAEFYADEGWILEDTKLDEFVVHAWCDLEPYGGEKSK